MSGEAEGAGEAKPSQGVFTHIIKTMTGANGYERDREQKDLKALSVSAVATEAALTSVPTGIDQSIIRGTSVHLTDGDRTDLVNGNEILGVDGTQTHTIIGNSQLGYDNNRRVIIGESDTLTVAAEQHVFVIGESDHQFVGRHEVTAPEEFEWKTFERGFTAYKIDTCVTNLDVHALEVNTHGMDVELALLKTRGGALEEVLKGQKGEADAIQVEISIEIDIKGRGDVLVDIGIGTPFR